MSNRIKNVRDWEVYKLAFETAMEIFQTTKRLSSRRKIFSCRSNQEVFKIGLFKFG